MKILSIFLFLPGIALAQVALSGGIYDKNTGQPIPFANIGIIGKPVGTVGDENGIFDFEIQENQQSDSVRVSTIGYRSLTFQAAALLKPDNKIYLEQIAMQLEAVVVRPQNVKYKILGSKDYTKNNCTGFADISGNWKGSETAIFIKNRKMVLIESFSFYVIQNKYEDSLIFRLMLYERIPGRIHGKVNEKENWVGPTFLKKPIIFKLGLKQGEFTLSLRDYGIQTSKDFFISLECLMDEMEITKFCYAGSVGLPSYFKVKAFSNWHKTYGTIRRSGGGGGDFNVKVSYAE